MTEAKISFYLIKLKLSKPLRPLRYKQNMSLYKTYDLFKLSLYSHVFWDTLYVGVGTKETPCYTMMLDDGGGCTCIPGVPRFRKQSLTLISLLNPSL